MSTAFGLAESLPTLVKSKYATAKAAEALSFAASELAIVRVCGSNVSSAVNMQPVTPIMLKSRAKKPQLPKTTPSTDQPKKKIDPFENPDQQMLIAEIPKENPSHLLVLNKFPIIPNHFILATKTNKPQTHALEKDDLWLTYRLLKEWQACGTGRLFAFFNSGDPSGASQPHRHIQLLPVEDMRHGDIDGKWELLIDALNKSDARPTAEAMGPYQHQLIPVGASQLPFRAFGARLSPDLSADRLHEIYGLLFKAAHMAAEQHNKTHQDGIEIKPEASGEMPISYNLAMTVDSLLLAPRRSDGKTISRHDGTELDHVAINGTVLGGTLMVKNEEVFKLLQNDPSKLNEIMEAIGIPNVPGISSANLAP